MTSSCLPGPVDQNLLLVHSQAFLLLCLTSCLAAAPPVCVYMCYAVILDDCSFFWGGEAACVLFEEKNGLTINNGLGVLSLEVNQ